MKFKYRVYYAPGSCHGLEIFDGTLENWGDTPIHEVLVIVQTSKEHGRKLVLGGDYYIWEGEEIGWIPCDRDTMYQYMARKGKEKRFLLGVMSDQNTWDKIVKQARLDKDFPKQTALAPYETKKHFKK